MQTQSDDIFMKKSSTFYSLVHFNMNTAVVLVKLLLGQSYWWDFMGVAPAILRGHSISKLPGLCLSFFLLSRAQ